MMIKKIKPKPHPRVPFKKAIGFSFFSFPSNSLGYRIFHFSFFSFPLNRRQPFLPFYLFTFKTAGSSRRFRVLFVLMLKAVMLQAEQPVVLRLDRQQVWA